MENRKQLQQQAYKHSGGTRWVQKCSPKHRVYSSLVQDIAAKTKLA